MYVIGTAGHVDHGKSTLVEALTGIDPDRLKEEKERQMTLDLGFAWLQLPGGEEVGVVDVPGHERLVRNMLAGVGGFDLAMLVVAADEGVMPQTREHLAILDLMRVKSGVVALTKRDLVDDDWLELVASDVRDVLAGTSLAEAPLVAVSSTTGQGLDELKAVVEERLGQTEERGDLGRPRLPVDRAFVMAGFGPVVTGTLVDGSLTLGQEVEVVPKGLRARIRGLQSHRKKLEEATPGRRLAVNLSGVRIEELERGDVVASPGWLAATDALDARVQIVAGAPSALKHNASVAFHTGTSETPARLRLLDANEVSPGDAGWAQLKLQRPVALVKGDLFILRNSWGTVGGGEVVEPRARRHRRFHDVTLQRLEVMEGGTPEDLVLEAVSAKEPCPAKAVTEATNLSWDQVSAAAGTLAEKGRLLVLGGGHIGRQTLLYTALGLDKLKRRIHEILEAFHRQYPLRRGMAKEELRSRLRLAQQSFDPLLSVLREAGEAVEDGPVVRMPSHELKLTAPQERQAQAYLDALGASPYNPPSDVTVDAEILAFLLGSGKVVRTAPGVVFSAPAYQEMVAKVKQKIQRDGKVTVAEVRDMLGTSRKYVLAFLEHLDQQRVTRRVGDERVLR